MQRGEGVSDSWESGVRGDWGGGDEGAGGEGEQWQTSGCKLSSGAPSCGSCLDESSLLLGHQARVEAGGLDLKIRRFYHQPNQQNSHITFPFALLLK